MKKALKELFNVESKEDLVQLGFYLIVGTIGVSIAAIFAAFALGAWLGIVVAVSK